MVSLWSEHRTPGGRLYWSHAETKQSVWEKPDELRTAFEKELAKTDWKQYTSKDKPYYVNSKTKETKWELPADLEALRKKLEAEEPTNKAPPTPTTAASATPSAAQGAGSPSASITGQTPVGGYGPNSRPIQPIQALQRHNPAVPVGPRKELPPKWPPGGFLTHEKAEEGFMRLLKYEGVDETSTWEETMRKIITHEMYRALDTLAEKKAAFVKYQHRIVEERQAAKESRVDKMRPVLKALFASRTDVIKPWSTMKTANKVFEADRNWKMAFEDEREVVLLEYTKELREASEKEERELKERNVAKLSSLVRQLDTIHIGTRWRQAHDIVVSSDAFKSDPDLQKIDTIDMMGVYDDYMRQLEGGQEEDAKRYRVKMARQARKARDGYRALMTELSDKGELTMQTKWKDLYPKIKDDERYLALLGQPGSGPLELWMDAVDDLAEETYRAAEKLDKAFKETFAEGSTDHDADSPPGKVTLDTSYPTFSNWITQAHMDNQISPALRQRVYDMHIARLEQQQADEARRAERKRRHRIDDLRYALKGISRHIELDMTFEEATEHMKGLKEWDEVVEEGDRREAFEKFIKRQKEKLEERDRYDRRHSKSGRHSEERESKRPRLSTKEVEEGEI